MGRGIGQRRKMLEHEMVIRDIAKRHGVKIKAVRPKKSTKYGPYIDVHMELRDVWEFPRVLNFMRELRTYFEEKAEHGAVNLAIGDEKEKYLLHFPLNYKKSDTKRLPKIKGVTLHHGPPKELYGKYALAAALLNENHHIFDDVGVMIEKNGENGVEEKRTLTDFDLLGINVLDNQITFRIGEVLTSNHRRIEHKARVWAEFFNFLKSKGFIVDVKPLILAVGLPNEMKWIQKDIDTHMKKNRFVFYGKKFLTTTKYNLWQTVVKNARHLPEDIQEEFIRNANRAIERDDINALYAYATLAETLPKAKKALNRGFKSKDADKIKQEILNFDRYIGEHGPERAAAKLFENIARYLPPSGRNHLKKRLGI
ncbi:MAG: hypothetical protein PWP76_727 [Candidatus Diapherotrites archaeon]|nr:hypothetical protein [Candidatus Diapherotrites archaeon]